ncbi:unnamed protein product [Clonostachys byssicola]|uniref:Uncharacterized protein n=1 Tax=Clonostachys byssicola TaxID=160290 RepID=A0A9N9Y494_9HYPO|nr:unnamed protein product [Clonostachys byssicola]
MTGDVKKILWPAVKVNKTVIWGCNPGMVESAWWGATRNEFGSISCVEVGPVRGFADDEASG